MSWLPHRWRTQWNAIRHANCKTSESSKLWTHLALPSGSMSVGVSVHPHQKPYSPQNSVWFLQSVACSFKVYLDVTTTQNYRSFLIFILSRGLTQEDATSNFTNNLKTYWWKLNRVFSTPSCLESLGLETNDSFILFGPPIRQEYPLNLSI
jgi:hypothetical protein